MSSSQAHKDLLPLLTPETRLAVTKQTESILLKIVRANLNTQYASKAPLLAELRSAVSAYNPASDTELVHAFRRCVPLSDYDAYKPFIAAFNATHYKEAEVENLFSPGLPLFLAISSGTSGKEPKIFPKYDFFSRSDIMGRGLTSAILFCGYRELKCVERESGQIVKKIPFSNGSSGMVRAALGWSNVDDDDSRMSIIAPGYVAPFAASMITHHQSFLMIHALFTLACGDTENIVLIFSTLFYDLLQLVDEQWDMFLSLIENGTVPELPGVQEVHAHLQVCFHANPDRSAELREIGPPSSCEGWAVRVWPKLKAVRFGCSGPFATVLPKLKTIIGPTVTIQSNGYVSSESSVGPPYRLDDPHTFVLGGGDLVEFLDMTSEESHQNLLQAWELEVGKQYEVVVTTRDGLWRYQLGDIIDITGFDPKTGFPAFVLSGRKSLSIRLAPVLISDSDIVSAVQTISPDVLRVNEYTTVLDDRQGTSTVGYLIELTGTPGPNAHLAPVALSKGLAAANFEYRTVLQDGEACNPSVRILRPGTFAAFRQWKAENMNVGPGQVKVPAVLIAEASKNWILERVVGEL